MRLKFVSGRNLFPIVCTERNQRKLSEVGHVPRKEITESVSHGNRADNFVASDLYLVSSGNFSLRRIFLKSDLYSSLNSKKFDVIVSNPPYIPNGTELQKEVTFEPRSALFTEDDLGLEYYNKIIPESLDYINDGGFLAFEIGFNQGADVYKLMENAGYKNIMIEKDMMGLDRVVYGIK